MTEPKHIPLTARLREYADAMAEEFRRVLQTPDDARDVAFEEEEREVCAWLHGRLTLDGPVVYCDDDAEQGSPYCTHHTTLLENR